MLFLARHERDVGMAAVLHRVGAPSLARAHHSQAERRRVMPKEFLEIIFMFAAVFAGIVAAEAIRSFVYNRPKGSRSPQNSK